MCVFLRRALYEKLQDEIDLRMSREAAQSGHEIQTHQRVQLTHFSEDSLSKSSTAKNLNLSDELRLEYQKAENQENASSSSSFSKKIEKRRVSLLMMQLTWSFLIDLFSNILGK